MEDGRATMEFDTSINTKPEPHSAWVHLSRVLKKWVKWTPGDCNTVDTDNQDGHSLLLGVSAQTCFLVVTFCSDPSSRAIDV